jgi:hypothetical protein
MKITKDDDFGGAVLNCAVRYALGRRTYMPGLVMDVIRPMLKNCSDKTLWCFDRDISGWLEKGKHGPADYGEEWVWFQEDVRAVMDGRKASKEKASTCLRDKVSRLIDAYIRLGLEDCHNDADIIDALAEIFTYEELKDFGAGGFVRDYFEDRNE